MSAGLLTWDAAGNPTAFEGMSGGLLFGVRTVLFNEQSFTITDTRFGVATPFFSFIVAANTTYTVDISVSGTTLTWSRTGGANASTVVMGYLFYGTYAA